MYLLDTNICIFAINKRSLHVLDRIKANLNNLLTISSLTIAELEFGVQNSQHLNKNKIALIKFLSIFNVLDFTSDDAFYFGKIKYKLKRNGTLIGPIDMLLAAQALRTNLIFVTNNTNEFERIDGLRIEDWSRL